MASFAAIYFAVLARWVHEPFVHVWHRTDQERLLSSHGFSLLESHNRFPFRLLVAELNSAT
jgi:hypothetical protein